MKTLLKKVLLLTVISVLLAACGAKSNDSSEANNSDEKQTDNGFTIGVMLYNYTDVQGKEIKSYGDYLAEHFNVNFNYATVGTSEEDHIAALENLIASGVDAVISGYDTSLEQSLQLAEQAKVYYGVALGDVRDDVTSEYFVGGLYNFGEKPETIGAQYAQAAYEAGVKNIGVTSFQEFAFVDAPAIISGFKEKLAELDTANEITVYDTEYHMFGPEDVSSAVTKVISDHSEVDAIFGLGSGMDFVYPAILNSTKPDIKVLALGYNDSTPAALENGSVLAAGTNNYSQIIANVFAQLYDRLNGHEYTDWELNGSVDYPIFSSVEEVEDFQKYIVPEDKSNGAVTVEELKQVMKTFNENATWQELQQLTTRTLSEIKEAR
ncbi:substrate-binding domain-containing protein [Robertmurraya sp. FSL W8-0741]|uniref:sugar ABC transporter substrate-binding protein n=1 Tax=Robertmurraya sp. FSL W8-0741 TaxID=2954629 RepID=UPI0030F6A3C4